MCIVTVMVFVIVMVWLLLWLWLYYAYGYRVLVKGLWLGLWRLFINMPSPSQLL
jgi:hypothetical protein